MPQILPNDLDRNTRLEKVPSITPAQIMRRDGPLLPIDRDGIALQHTLDAAGCHRHISRLRIAHISATLSHPGENRP